MSTSTDKDQSEPGLAPDAQIEEAARVCLQHSPYRALRAVNCRFHDGELSLEGTVPTFHYKQLAQTAVAEIQGVERVVNKIDVA